VLVALWPCDPQSSRISALTCAPAVTEAATTT
jgi:hypothetical protein